jgi:hypothetical protein
MVDLDDSLYPMGSGEIVIPVEAKINTGHWMAQAGLPFKLICYPKEN